MAYITVDVAKQWIGGISSGDDDPILTALITAVELFIENYTRRDFEADADSTRTLDAEADVDGQTLWLDRDLCSITTVTTNADASGGGTALTEDTDFVTEPKNDTPYYALKMLASSSESWTYTDDPELGITIAGRWGYSTSPPADIVLACKDIVKTVYRSRDANTDTFITGGGIVITPNQVPKMTMLTLNRYVRR
jgi:hypothetical protein